MVEPDFFKVVSSPTSEGRSVLDRISLIVLLGIIFLIIGRGYFCTDCDNVYILSHVTMIFRVLSFKVLI